MFKRRLNRLFFFRRTLWLPAVLRFRRIVALTLDNAKLLLDLCNIERRNLKAVLFLDIRLNLSIGRFAFGLGDLRFIHIQADMNRIVRLLLGYKLKKRKFY